MKEKKLNSRQKIALERIYRLFDLAEQMQKSDNKDKNEFVKRYLKLAKRIGEKLNVTIPKELKKTYCRACFGKNVKGKDTDGFFIVTCSNCGHTRKYALK